MKRLFGTDGVRGVANEELTCDLALSIGRATAAVLSSGGRRPPRVLLGMDPRLSSQMLSSALRAGLCSMGAEVLDLGVLPTPAVAALLSKYNADAGVMISASHNSYEYNGIKIFGGDGFKLADEAEEEIEALVLEGNLSPTAQRIGSVRQVPEAVSEYLDHLRKAFPDSLSGLRIGVDCANGAASVCAKELFTSLGADCVMIHDQPDGRNINEKCGSTHLASLAQTVVAQKLDCGIAFDGDADRLLCVDEKGDTVDGDQILAMLALDMKERGKLRGNALVGTVMSNLGLWKFCEQEGLRFVPEQVGDRYVLACMNREQLSLGGEQSGHVILREFATTGDGELTALGVLSLMKRKRAPLSALAAGMRRYPQYMENLRVSGEGKVLFRTDGQVRSYLAEVSQQLEGKGRLLVRPSGTEPLIRVMAEGETEEMAKEAVISAVAFLRKRLGE